MLSIWLARASCSLNQLLDSAINYTDKLKRTENLLKVNARLAQSIAQTGLQFYNITSSELDEFIRETEAQGRRADRTSVSQSMKHFVRDWADEGYTERQESFQCILRSLSQIPRTDDRPLRVLLPGAGLGRLAHEIHKLGGTCPV
jgi:carnosine N-methyltransferase